QVPDGLGLVLDVAELSDSVEARRLVVRVEVAKRIVEFCLGLRARRCGVEAIAQPGASIVGAAVERVELRMCHCRQRCKDPEHGQPAEHGARSFLEVTPDCNSLASISLHGPAAL